MDGWKVQQGTFSTLDPFGYSDMVGTYRPVLLVSAGICVILSLIALTIRAPKKDQREQPA